jgi:hypothetical protein
MTCKASLTAVGLIGLLLSPTESLARPSKASAPSAYGSIWVSLRDYATSKPIPWANVILRDTKIGGLTDGNGVWKRDSVPAGTYELVAMAFEYQKSGVLVIVKEGKCDSLRVKLYK